MANHGGKSGELLTVILVRGKLLGSGASISSRQPTKNQELLRTDVKFKESDLVNAGFELYLYMHIYAHKNNTYVSMYYYIYEHSNTEVIIKHGTGKTWC